MSQFDKSKYDPLSDVDIVKKIITRPYDMEAAYYLLYRRYYGYLKKIYYSCRGYYEERVTKGRIRYDWFEEAFDDVVSELFWHLRGEDDWRQLRKYDMVRPFRTWFYTVAHNFFIGYLRRECDPDILDMDETDDEDRPKRQFAAGEEDWEIELNRRKALLMDAIYSLDKEDWQFVMLERLHGNKSKDIAEHLQEHWEYHGIVRRNKNGGIVEPTDKYVNVQMDRAKEKVKEYMDNHKD